MQTIRVWAPKPESVELAISSQRIPMIRQPGDWWTVELPSSNDDYGFILDGEGPFPDPRSLFQPKGATGLSHCINHDPFAWGDAGWQAPPLASAIIYELHVGTFTARGTFEAAIEKLDHLVELGVTHVELMPVNEFSGERGWGYDGVGLFAPHHAYGTPDSLKRLVEACHLKNLGVILDVVYNHFGPVGNYWGKFGAYTKDNFATPWGPAINFDDADSDEVRRFFCDNALMWLRDYHFDGLRLDALHAIVDNSPLPFVEQLSDEVKTLEAQLGRHLALIAENDRNDPRMLWARSRGGFALNAHWNDDFHHALHAVLTGERNEYYSDFGSLEILCAALERAYVYAGNYSSFRKRRQGRPPDGLEGSRFLAYLQNHDQIGNRALGERSARLMSIGRLKAAAALVFTSPFLPMLFQGEEWAASTPFLYFCNHSDPELAEKVRKGRRAEFPAFSNNPEQIPDPQAEETFLRSKLIWEEMSLPAHADILDWHKRLIHLRKSNPELCDGRMESVRARSDENTRCLTVERGAWTVVCNFGSESLKTKLSDGSREIVMASQSGIIVEAPMIALPPDSVAILGPHKSWKV